MVLSQPQLLLKVSEVMLKVHMKHFGGEKVLMLMEPQKGNMLSSVMKTMKWCVWEGIIFIMKNPGMYRRI